jgi:tRNA (uracil-5-)-methyltransferase TRM9
MKPELQEKLLKIVKNNYQEIASQFDVTRKKHLWPELETIFDNLKENESVLDVGCGNGRLLEALKNKKIKYLGVDNSEALIKLAQKNYPENIFKVVDVLNLEKEIKEKFSLVVSIAVLHHLPSRELRLKSLEQLRLVSTSGGKIIFSVWNLWPNKKFRKYLLKNIWQKITFKTKLDFGDLLFPWKNSHGEEVSERYYHAFTKRELTKDLQLAGFKKFSIKKDKYNYWVSIDTL